MSRLRATTSPTDTDREIQLALDRAAREIEVALRVAAESPLLRHLKRRTVGDLRTALDSVQRVRYTQSPETERESYKDWKARRDLKRQAQKQRAVAPKEPSDV